MDMTKQAIIHQMDKQLNDADTGALPMDIKNSKVAHIVRTFWPQLLNAVGITPIKNLASDYTDAVASKLYESPFYRGTIEDARRDVRKILGLGK